MNSKRSQLTAVLTGAIAMFAGAVHGQDLFSTNFDNYDNTLTLADQAGWATNDVYQPNLGPNGAGDQTAVGVVTGYSATPADYWSVLGGLTADSVGSPGIFNPKVWHPFSSFGVLNSANPNANALQFNVEFGVSSSSTPRTNQDAFKWDFENSSGGSVFGLSLTPTANGLQFNYVDSNGNVTVEPQTIPYDSIFNMTVDVQDGGAGTDKLSVFFADQAVPPDNFTFIKNLTIPHDSAIGISQIAAEWDITNHSVDANNVPNGFGSNSLIFNNYDVKVAAAPTPEPSALLAIVSGAAVLINSRRRRA